MTHTNQLDPYELCWSTWSIWLILINLIHMSHTHMIHKLICMTHMDHVDLYALYISYNSYRSCWSIQTHKSKNENAAINGDAKLTSMVEQKDEAAGPQCRQRPPNAPQTNLQGKETVLGGEETRTTEQKKATDTWKKKLWNAWTVLGVQVLNFKWRAFSPIHLKCWVHLATPYF